MPHPWPGGAASSSLIPWNISCIAFHDPVWPEWEGKEAAERRRKDTVPGRQGQRPEYQEAGPGCWLVRGCRGARSAPGTRVPRLCVSWDVPPCSKGLPSPWSTGKGRGESEKQKEEGVSLIDGTLAL